MQRGSCSATLVRSVDFDFQVCLSVSPSLWESPVAPLAVDFLPFLLLFLRIWYGGRERGRDRDTMVQTLIDGALGLVTTLEFYMPAACEGSSPRWSGVQSVRVVAAVSSGAPVQDATAAPPVRRNCYQLAPSTLTLKARKSRKRGGGGRSNGEGGDGHDGGNGNYGGDGSWGGSGNGKGGWDSWGESWDDDIRPWKQGTSALALLYQAACWLSLSNCLHYVLTLAFRCPNMYSMWLSVLGVYITISLSKCVHNVLSLLP